MKKLLLLVTVLALNLSSAQELSTNKVDDFTGKTIKKTKYYTAGNGYGVLKTSFINIVNPEKGTSFYYLKIYPTRTDYGCAGSSKNYLTLLFDDGTKLELKNDVSEIDCADYSASAFILSDRYVNEIKTKTVKKIRFSQSDGYADFNVYGTYTLSQQIKALNN